MSNKIAPGLLILIAVSSANGQQRRANGQELQPNQGNTSLFVTPAYGRRSLLELTNAAELIVDCYVEHTAVRQREQDSGLETDVTLQSLQILKGKLPAHEFIVSQAGGVRGQYRETPHQYALMQAGERYLLFLVTDKRPGLPTSANLPRYNVDGVWSGMLKVDTSGNVHISSAASSGLRSQVEGASVATIFSEIAALLKQ